MRNADEAVAPPATPPSWVSRVAESAAAEAGAPVHLLGEYLAILADAAVSGQRPEPDQLSRVRQLGRLAAEEGIEAERAVDLYLSAAWRLWRAMPVEESSVPGDSRAAAEAVLRVINDAVDVLVDGHQEARRRLIRQEESARRGFVDDLLRGDTDLARLVQRAEPFGVDLASGHQVLLAAPKGRGARVESALTAIERAVVGRFGDRDVLVATKDALLVVITPAVPKPVRFGASETVHFLHGALADHTRDRWQVATGRPYSGAYGIARSYEEARESLLFAQRLHLDADTIEPRDLLVYRVVGRDQVALVDLVEELLAPLTSARGGARPLLETLETYFGTGGVTTETARRLHLSVRAVSYRLTKIKTLTGIDPGNPGQRLALHLAVLGARLLDWPDHNRPANQ